MLFRTLLRSSLGNHTFCRVRDCCEQLQANLPVQINGCGLFLDIIPTNATKTRVRRTRLRVETRAWNWRKKKCMNIFISATFHEDQQVDKSDWCRTETLVTTVRGRTSILTCSNALISYSIWVQGQSWKVGYLRTLSIHLNIYVYDIKSIFYVLCDVYCNIIA